MCDTTPTHLPSFVAGACFGTACFAGAGFGRFCLPGARLRHAGSRAVHEQQQRNNDPPHISPRSQWTCAAIFVENPQARKVFSLTAKLRWHDCRKVLQIGTSAIAQIARG